MYALSLGFIIFINVSFSVSINSFTYSIQQINGVKLKVVADEGFDEDGVPWQIGAVGPELEAVALGHGKVDGFAWISAPLAEIIPDITNIQITNLGHYFGA